MDIAGLYGKYLPLIPAQTPARRAEQAKGVFRSSMDDLGINRTNAYAKSNRPKQSDSEINEIAGKYDFQHMDQEQYDAFLDDLVDKGVLTRAETGYFGYGGTVQSDALDSKVMIVFIGGQEPKYSQHTPFFADSRVQGYGDMAAWLSELMESTEYSAYPEAFERVRQRCEMYGAIYDVVARATNSPAYAAGDSGEPDLIDQIADPNSAFYQDMLQRMRLQWEQSEEEKEEQAIIDALGAILDGMRSTDGVTKRKDMAASMAGLSKQISELDAKDPRRKQLDLLRQRLNQLGIFVDLDLGVKGSKDKDKGWQTLTQHLIDEENSTFDPSIFDLI